MVVNLATQRDDEIVTFQAARFDRAKGARIYTLNLFDELARHASGAGDLARSALMAEGRLDGQIELEASWRDAAVALGALLDRRIGGKAVLRLLTEPRGGVSRRSQRCSQSSGVSTVRIAVSAFDDRTPDPSSLTSSTTRQAGR